MAQCGLPARSVLTVSTTAFSESTVKMSDKISLRQILDLSVPVVLLVVTSGGLVYAIKIAATLRDLRALEPVTLATDPETWRCPHATHFPGSSLVRDGEPGLNTSGALRLPDAPPDRVASCLPHTPQVRAE